MDGGRREGAWDAARRVYRTGGVMAFWDGLGPKVSLPGSKFVRLTFPAVGVSQQLFLNACDSYADF